jgi:hypothetical protein
MDKQTQHKALDLVAGKFFGRRIQFIGGDINRRIEGWGETTPPAAVPLKVEDATLRPLPKGGHLVRIGGVDDHGRQVVFSTHLDEPFTDNVKVHFVDKEEAAARVIAGPLRKMRYFNMIGADPEVFIKKGDGSLFPAFEFLGGKDDVSGALAHEYWDGYQAEFRFPPFDCMDVLVTYVARGLRNIMTAARAKDAKASLDVRTTVDIPVERLTSDLTDHVQFGCTPSLNVYGDTVDFIPGSEVPFRSSGGHLHFSVPDGSDNKLIPLMIKDLDRILGVIGVSVFQRYDDPRRRFLYGFEYRVLSSAWMLAPGLTQFVYEMARHIVGYVINTGKQATWWDVTDAEAKECINNCDVSLAHKLLNRNTAGLKALLLAMPQYESIVPWEAVERCLPMIYNGVHTVLRDPDNFSHTWKLELDAKKHPHVLAATPRTWSGSVRALETTGFID